MNEKQIWAILENLPSKNGQVGPTLVHDFRQCVEGNNGKWQIQFCWDFGYSPIIYGNTALDAVKKGLAFLEAE